MNKYMLSTRIWVRGTILAVRHPRLVIGYSGEAMRARRSEVFAPHAS